MIDYSDYISAFFIWYIPMVIFTFFVFDILGVKKIYSIIPIYNVYKLLDEYQGRVWKKHWGVFYVILSILPILRYIAPTIIIFLLYMFYPITLVLSLPLTIFIFGLTLVIIYLPLLRNNFFKFILLLNLLLPIIRYMISIYIYYNVFLIIALVIFFNYFYAFVAFDTWRKVKSGKYVVYEKLDYSKLSSSDIKAELASRGRVLVHPLERTEKLEPKAELNDEKRQLEKLN